MTNYNTDEIKGRKVVERGGREVGTIDDVVISPDTWRVDSFLVAVNDEVAEKLQLSKKRFGRAHVRVGPERVNALADYLTLNVTVDEMRSSLETEGTGSSEEAS